MHIKDYIIAFIVLYGLIMTAIVVKMSAKTDREKYQDYIIRVLEARRCR
jgi:hypothetical protein